MRKSFTRLLSLVMFLTLLSSFAMAAVTTWPKDGTTPAYTKTTDKIMVIFPEAVKAGSGYVRLYSGASGTNLERSILANDSRISYAKGDTVVIDFSADQKELVKYTVAVENTVFKTVADGTAISVPQWSYTVGDYTAPVLSKVEPVKDANVGQLSSLKVTFTDASPVVLGKGNVALYKADGNVWDLIDVATRGSVTNGTTAGTYVLTLTGIRGLEDLTSYAVTVGAGVVTDNGLRADGKKNAFAGLTDRTVWTFSSKDFTVPGFATDYPKASNIGVTSFDVLVKTVEAGSFYAKAYTTTQTVDETLLSDLTGTTAVTLTAGTEAKKSFSSLVKNTKYYVYVVTKNGDVSPTADDISDAIEVTTIDSDKPVLANVVYVKGDASTTASVSGNLVTATTIDQAVSKIIFDFAGNVDKISVGSGSIVVYKKSDNSVYTTIDASNISINDDGNAVATLSVPFGNATEYYAFIPSTLFKDQYNNFYGGITTTTGWKFSTNDIIAPTVVSYTPAQGESGVAVDKNIVVKFSEVMNIPSSGSTDANYFTLEVDGATATYTYTHSTNNNEYSTVTINPGLDFPSLAVITLTVNGNIKDASANQNVIGLTQGVSFIAKDIEGPTMDFKSLPEVPADPIVVKFSEPIYLLGGTAVTSSNLYTLITLKETDQNGLNVNATYSINSDKTVITITPASPWASGKTYYVAISSDVQDAGANKCVDVIADRSHTFQIADVLPAVVSIDKAGKTDVGVSNNISISFKNENDAADPLTNGKLFYEGVWNNYSIAGMAKIIVLKVGDANGANVPFNVTTGDNATFVVDPISDLDGATTYYVGIGASTQDASGNVNAAKYGSFTTLLVGTPVLSSLSPAKNQIEVAVKAEPVATFNTDVIKIASASYTGSDVVSIYDGTSTSTVAYADVVVSGKTVTIKHSTDFASNTNYRITIPSTVILNKNVPYVGITTISDWTFTTVDKRFEAFTLSPDYQELADLDAKLVITVPEKVVAGTGNISIKNADTDYLIEQISSSSSQVAITYNSNTTTIKVTPSANFVYGGNYYVEVDNGAFVDMYANKIPAIVGKTSSATTTNWTFTAVNTDLAIVTKGVKPVGENVANDADIVVTFNREIKKGTAGQIGFNEYKTSDGSLRQEVRYGITSTNLIVSGNTLTIKHADKLFTNDSKVYLFIESGAIQAATKTSTIAVGGTYSTSTSEGYYFYVGDALPPVATVVPTWDATAKNYVQVNTNITISFNEDVLNNVTGLALTNGNVTYNGGIIELQGPSGVVDFQGTVSGRTITIDPTADLSESSDYTVRILANTIKDTHNHPMGLTEAIFKTTDTTLPSIGTVTATAAANSITVTSVVVTEIHPNKFYYVLKKKSDVAPTLAEVKVANNKAYSDGSAFALNAFNNLDASTTYVLYYLADDTFGNTTTVKSKEITTVDAVAPLLVSVDPANGTLNVDYAKDIVFTFNEAVQLGSGNVYIKDRATNSLVNTIAVSGSTMTVVTDSSEKKIALTQDFASDMDPIQVYIEMDKGAIKDKATTPNDFAGIFGPDKVYFTYEDNTSPEYLSFDYEGTNSMTVELNSNIVLNFSEEVQAGTANVILHEGTSTDVTVSSPAIEVFKGSEVAISGKSVTINPTYSFKNNTMYYLEIQAGFVKDKSSNKNASLAGSAVFGTSENVAPTVAVTSPEEFDGNNKSQLTDIYLHFDENVYLKIAGLKKSLLVLTEADVKSKVSFAKADGTAVPYIVADKDGDDLHLEVDIDDLADLTSYVLTVSGFMDIDGLVMETTSFNYTTGDGKVPTYVFNPADDTKNVVSTTPLTITFSEPIYRSVAGDYNEGTAAIWYVPFTNDNVDEVVYLYDVDADADVAFDATFNGTNKITLVPTKALISGHTYIYGLEGTFTDINGNDIHTYRFDDYALKTKAASISLTQSWAEFTVLDTDKPVFVIDADNVHPATEATAVPAAEKMWIKFNETVVVGSGSIIIRHEDGTIFETISGASLSIDADDDHVLNIAHKNLESDATYFVEIGEGVVTDKAGNKNVSMTDPTKWVFTTKDTFDLTATVTPVGDNTPRTVSLTLAFNKAPIAQSNKFLSVYKEDGTAVYQKAVSSLSVIGKEAIYAGVELDANQAYYARVEGGAFKDASGNLFAGIMDNTWTFSTVDNIAPKVVTLTPADNANAVDTQTSALVMTFDRDIAAGSGMIAVRYTTNGVLFEEVSVANAVVNGKNLTINLTKALEANTGYYVIVPASAVTNTEVTKDTFAGIINTYTWNFTTSTDQTAPKLVTWTPNATTIADNHPAFTMTFDENVVLGAGSLKVYNAADGKLALSIPVTTSMVTGKTVSVTYTFDATLKNGLDKNTDYYVLVDAGVVKDAAANAFAGVTATTTWTFKTGKDFATDTDPVIDNSLKFKVYPNPFVDYVIVDNASELTKVVITNIAGQVVKEVVTPDSRIQLNELRSGVYFISLYKGNTVAKTVKIAKR